MDGDGMAGIEEEAQALEPDLLRWRRHLHQNPELGYQERDTQVYIRGELEAMGLRPRDIAGTGLVVDLGSGDRGVAIRADIDALPLQEETDLPFRSERPGAMHACGHDGHTAMVLGVARILSQRELPGRVRLMFQPAEEVLPGGALSMIEEGVLDGIDRVLGVHVSSGTDTGLAGAADGAQTANADDFTITIEGKGGHGASPHETNDALVAGAALVGALQTIVSRSLAPREPGVVTVGTFHSGSAMNIIAQRAELTGTVRTFTPEARARIKERMAELTEHICRAHGCTGELRYREGYPSVVNAPEERAVLAEVTREVLGSDGWHQSDPIMAGDDMAYYQQERPGAFLMLGARNPEAGAVFPHHHPRFTFDEAAMPAGVAILAGTALRLLQE